MIWPVASPRRVITSPYGWRTIFGEREFHAGTDIGDERGSFIVAVADGEVDYASNSITAGNFIRIQHGHGVITRYLHMDVLLVGKGPVTEGQVIGTLGATGKVTGPHLHFDVIINGQRVDPCPYLFGHPLPMPSVLLEGRRFYTRIINGRSYMAVRSPLEHIGYEVGWEQETLTATTKRRLS